MNHVAVEQFWNCYNTLPVAVKKLVDGNFSIIKQYPKHPLLRLLEIENIMSMRIGSRLRALGIVDSEEVIWFWVGTYKQYKLLTHAKKEDVRKKY